MELQRLLEKTAEYVLGRWHAKSPTYREDPAFLSLPPVARRSLRDLFPRIKEGIDFEELVKDAQVLTEQQAFSLVNQNVPNSQTTQVVEFCSGPGIRFAYGFAKRHPQTDVILVDELDAREILQPGMCTPTFAQYLKLIGKTDEEIQDLLHRRGFERYQKDVPFRGDVQEFMQRLFEQNGAPNMKYAHKWVKENTGISDVIQPGKKTYCAGWNCPGDAGIHALKEAVKQHAEAIILTMSGTEFLSPELHCRLSKEPEIKNWDRVSKLSQATTEHREKRRMYYDYDKPEERRLGFALKHARILDALLWLEENGYKTRLILLDDEKTYNAPEHIVYAFKEHDVLK
jgi:hypothetical protein